MGTLSKILLIGALVVAGCGGGDEDSPPGPLASHFEMKFIVQFEDAQQAPMAAQTEWNKAQAAEGGAKAKYDEMSTLLTAAKNDRAKAKLEVDTALSNKKSAEASGDTNKMNSAQKDLRTAELSVKAADARIKYYEAYRNWLKVHWRYTQEDMYWREAQFELAKSKVGQAHNVAPKGVNYQSFPSQEQSRGKRAASAKQKSEGGKGKATSAREEWVKAQQTADQASGKPSAYPDPLAGAATTAGS
jgi:hypothetical protein